MFKKFQYFRPETFAEAFALLTGNEDVQVLAGGTDLLLNLREESTPDKVVVDIKKLPGLSGIEEREDYFAVGALTTIRELQLSQVIKEEYTALWNAATEFGCLEIRNRATLGGNIVHASPGAESGTPLFAYEAEVEVVGPEGSRRLSIADFWQDVGRVDLRKGEILARILLPRYQAMKSSYHRLSRVKGMDLAILGATVVAVNPDQPADREIRVALGAVARTPYRNQEVEEMLSHRKLDQATMEKAKKKLSASIAPRASSLRAKPPYKKAMVGALTEKCLQDLSLLEGGA
ncbi:MAG: FAD binding domain-containing protein [Halanaerobium sp.]|nr:FAD binding domain-containing protein [Halanaerobium sp.]